MNTRAPHGIAAGTSSPAVSLGAFDDRARVDIHPGGVPAIVRPRDPRLAENLDEFVAWFSAHKENIDQLAARHGALLFRGFPLRSTPDFQRAIDHYPSNNMSYVGGAAPREKIAERVFESTQSPKTYPLMLHQEMAYLPAFPRMIAFYSRKSAWAGGETILADIRELEHRLPRRFWDEVKARGVRYARNFRAPGPIDPVRANMHKDWPTAFQTTDRNEAEAACRSVGLDPHWEDDGSLSTFYTAPGFVQHPLTGQTLWFNHIASQTQHPRGLGPERWATFVKYFQDQPIRPRRTTYGDGGDIDMEDVEQLHLVLEAITIALPWQDNDLFLFDNIMTAHGRNPYEGERDLQVALLG